MLKQIKYQLIKSKLKNRQIDEVSAIEAERKHKDEQTENYNDSSYFNGIDDTGQFFLSRMSFRTGKPNEHWLELKLHGIGLLSRKMPLGDEKEGFRQGNMIFEMIEPKKKWRVVFEGDMMDKKGENHYVELDMIFNAATPMVDFQNAMILENTARKIAHEKWTKSFFEDLKEIKKMHFEQGGELSGTIAINGVQKKFSFYSMRDHSWGKRIWGDWKRHCWMCGMLDNGDCINVSMISYKFLGLLAAGYYIKKGKIFYLREFPELNSFAFQPLFPDHVNLDYVFENNHKINFSWERFDYVPFVMDEGKYKIFEGISNGEVNGVKGRFVTEFGFNPEFYEVEKI